MFPNLLATLVVVHLHSFDNLAESASVSWINLKYLNNVYNEETVSRASFN